MYIGERDYRRPLPHVEEANMIELGNGTQTVEP